jgi:hypothetical protein
LLRIAVNGWLISCAIAAVSALTRATRSACQSRLRSWCASSSERARAIALANTSAMMVSRTIRSFGHSRALRKPANETTAAVRPRMRSGMERCERSPLAFT